VRFVNFLYVTVQCGGRGQDHRARDFQRKLFVTVIQEIIRMRETPELSTDFAEIRREIAGISRRHFRRVWRNILRDAGRGGSWRLAVTDLAADSLVGAVIPVTASQSVFRSFSN